MNIFGDVEIASSLSLQALLAYCAIAYHLLPTTSETSTVFWGSVSSFLNGLYQITNSESREKFKSNTGVPLSASSCLNF